MTTTGAVLVVEDEQKVANALREGLESEGYAVAVASTGEDAFFRVSTETFGDPVEGTAFSVEYTRVVRQSGTVKREERYTWSYEAPPG